MLRFEKGACKLIGTILLGFHLPDFLMTRFIRKWGTTNTHTHVNHWINGGSVGSKVHTKDAHWLWIEAAEPNILSLSRVPRGDSDILGAGDIQKSEEIVLRISRYAVCECICGLSDEHSGCSNVFLGI